MISTPHPAIRVDTIVKHYKRRGAAPVRALDGVSFDVRRGEIFGLLGPNGAGKTTMIRILTTLVQPTAGGAQVNGYDVLTHPLDVRRSICVVLQENAVELYLSIRDNLRTYARFHAVPKEDIDARVDRLLDLFDLTEYRSQKPIDLSGGVKRRLQVAKVFMVEKPIVFLDEATTGMDALSKRATIRAIREEAQRGRTVVLTTHILEEAEELCDSVTILNHGTLVATGPIESFKSMGERIVRVILFYRSLTKTVVRQLRAFRPLRFTVRSSSVELTVQSDAEVMRILRTARRHREFVSFEAVGASLEDIFVQLLEKDPSGRS